MEENVPRQNRKVKELTREQALCPLDVRLSLYSGNDAIGKTRDQPAQHEVG